MLATARGETGLAIVTEVMAPEHVPMVSEYADVLQIGARNMQNYQLLQAVGDSGKPALLKRGMSATLEEFLLAAEYILDRGNPNVMLCERGIRTLRGPHPVHLAAGHGALPSRQEPPAGGRRSVARHGQVEAGHPDVPGRRRRRRRRPDHRGSRATPSTPSATAPSRSRRPPSASSWISAGGSPRPWIGRSDLRGSQRVLRLLLGPLCLRSGLRIALASGPSGGPGLPARQGHELAQPRLP